ncbi:FAD-dependent oxidoreductase [Halobellus limi]|uniref:FAD binding domain-containing protein n=1 Tax=Halobellus limi TaxID=699433 RepID=A0A1H5YQH8_9EURY|nr:FAD-dependent oxidoreductase [Halobellus limi]QCC48383.1 FAD-binding protein [Halobellus limi]SEG25865.1 FAD binding domain-containing protein [Halobellus limi]
MSTRETDSETADVLVGGGGVAGLTAATFTARAGLDTTVVDTDESILARNAHLENVPGFPGGVDARRFLDLLVEQAEENGVRRRTGRVTDVERTDEDADPSDGGESHGDADPSDGDAFEVSAVSDGGETRTYRADAVVAASWSDASYLDGLGVETRDAGSKTYVIVDDLGRTDVEGVYAAGRLTEKYHQAVVAAGHGAEVGLTVVHDSETPYYHDWVTPEGYFTDRGREVPPGCEEIDAAERERRDAESRDRMREAFEGPHPEPQRTHPSLVDDELGRLDE